MLLERNPKHERRFHPDRIIPPPEGMGCLPAAATAIIPPAATEAVRAAYNGAVNLLGTNGLISEASSKIIASPDIVSSIASGALIALRTWDNLQHRDTTVEPLRFVRETLYKTILYLTPQLFIEMTKLANNPDSIQSLKGALTIAGLATAISIIGGTGARLWEDIHERPAERAQIAYRPSPPDEQGLSVYSKEKLDSFLDETYNSDPKKHKDNVISSEGECEVRTPQDNTPFTIKCPQWDSVGVIECLNCPFMTESMINTVSEVAEKAREHGWTVKPSPNETVETPLGPQLKWYALRGDGYRRDLVVAIVNGDYHLISKKISTTRN